MKQKRIINKLFVNMMIIFLMLNSFSTVFAEGHEEQSSGVINGNLTKDGTALADVTFSIHTTTEQPQWYDATSNSNGEFNFQLADGEYQVDGIWIEGEKHWYELNQVFNVVDGKLAGADKLSIALTSLPVPEKNVNGSLTKNGEALSGIVFSVHTTGENVVWHNGKTDANGLFALELPDGEYKIDGIWIEEEKKWHELNRIFTVAEGTLQGEEKIEILLTTPLKVLGSVTLDESPLLNTVFSLHTTSGETKWYNVETDSNGNFGIELPDGEYQIDGIWVESAEKWFEINQKFNVLDNKLVGAEKLNISLSTPPQPSEIHGMLNKDDAALKDIVFSLHTTQGETKWYNARSDAEGKFTLTLPDGEYQIDGVWIGDEEKWYVLNQKFTVSEGKLVGSDELLIVIKSTDIKGLVRKDGTPFSGIEFSLHSTGENPEWHNVKTDENGNFSLSSLADGNYQIDGIWVEEEKHWYELNKIFTIVDGSLQDSEQLIIELNTPSEIKGFLKKEDGSLPGILFSIHTNGQQETNWYSVITDDAGNFSLNLPDGEYQIDGIWLEEEEKWYVLNQVFNVADGKLDGATELSIIIKNIVEPEINVRGKITQEQQPLADLSFSIYSMNDNEWIDVRTDENGDFGIHLPDGQYTIQGIWVASEEKWYPLKKTYLVEDGVLVDGEINIDLTTPELGTLRGNLSIDSVPEGYAYFYIYNIDTYESFYGETDNEGTFSIDLPEGDYIVSDIYLNDYQFVYGGNEFTFKNEQVILNGEVKSNLPLQLYSIDGKIIDPENEVTSATVEIEYSNGYISYIETDDQGNFSYLFLDGKYKINRVHPLDSYFQIETDFEFEIRNGDVFINDVNDNLEVHLPAYSLNVTLLYNEQPIQQEYIYMYNEENSYEAMTDDSGNFKARLKDGTYVLESDIYNQYTQNYEYVRRHVTVENGVTIPNPYVIDIANPQGNTKGNLLDSNGNPIIGAEITFKEENSINYFVKTYNNGRFGLDLEDGNYVITGYVTDGNFEEMNYSFSVRNGILFKDNVQIDEINLVSSSSSFLTKVVDNQGNELNVSEINVVNDETYDWHYFYSDENGMLNTILKDGEYTLEEMVVENQRMDVSIPFTVLNGQLIRDGQIVNELIVTAPNETLKGQVLDGLEPIEGASVYVSSSDGSHYFSSKTDEQGFFEMRLEDGEYFLVEVDASGTIDQNIPFTIMDGKMLIDGVEQEMLQIVLPPLNLKGIVKENEDVIPYAHIELRQLSEEGWFRYQNFFTDSYGQFTGRLDNGEYEITQINSEHETARISYKFEVMDGKIYVNGSLVDQLEVEFPPVTLNGVLVDNGQPLSHTSVQLVYYNVNGDWEYFNLYTNENGEFYGRLPDGYYRLASVDNGNNTVINKHFNIVNGIVYVNEEEQSLLTIDLQANRGTVSVKDAEGQIIPNANVQFVQHFNGVTEYFNATSDENGNFSIPMQDGDYEVTQVWFDNSYIELTKDFYIQEGKFFVNNTEVDHLDIIIPKVAFEFFVYNEEGVPLSNAGISLRNYENGEHHVLETTSDGHGFARLLDGTYEIRTIYHPSYDQEIALTKVIEVRGGELYIATVLTETLELTVPSINFKGKIFNSDNQPIPDTYLEIQKESFDTFIIPVDQQGAFAARLGDGNYKVIGLYLEGYESFILNKEFTIADGKLHVNDEQVEELNITLPQMNVNGVVLEEGAPVGNVYLYYGDENYSYGHSVLSAQDGKFQIALPDGNYKIYGFSVGEYGQYHDMDLPFEVIDSKLYINGTEEAELKVSIPPVTLKGKILEDEANVDYVYFDIRNTLTGEHFGTDTLSDGTFENRLPDGEYEIPFLYAGGSVPVNLLFTIDGGQLYVEGVLKDTLDIQLPPITVTGSIPGGLSDLLYGEISVTDNETDKTYTGELDYKGRFSLRLPDGEYTIGDIRSWETGAIYYIHTGFSVENGELIVEGGMMEELTVELPSINVSGKITENGIPLLDADISISKEDNDYWRGTTNHYGEFNIRLSDGEYVITYISSIGSVNIPVTYYDGVLTVDGEVKENLNLVFN